MKQREIPELVVFDMAGTTIEATSQVPRAFAAAMRWAGLESGAADIEEVRGRAKPDAIRELLTAHRGEKPPEKEVRAVHQHFRRGLLAAYREQGVRPIDGSGRTFNWLRSRGVRYALTTGFDRELARLLVTLADWAIEPDALVTNDDVARGRPAPDLVLEAMALIGVDDPRQVAVAGDTVSDLRSAHAAGAGWVFGVLSGAHDRSRLGREPHTAILDSVADLPAWFES